MIVDPSSESALVAYLGLEMLRFGGGRCEMRMLVRPEHRDAAGNVPPGILAIIIDTAAGAAAASGLRRERGGPTQVTVEMHVTCFEPVDADVLLASGQLGRIEGSRVLADGNVTNEQGEALAAGRATFLLVDPPRPRPADGVPPER